MSRTPEAIPPESWEANPLSHARRYFASWIQGLFAQCPPGAYRWVATSGKYDLDSSESEIFITGEGPVNVDTQAGKRPAISVSRGPAAFQGTSINDLANRDLASGAVSRMDVLPTTLVINALSRVPLEAEGLAWFVGKYLWLLREDFLKGQRGILFAGARPSFSAVSPAGALVTPDVEHNWVVCSVSFPTYLQFSMTATPINTGTITGARTNLSVQESVTKPEAVVALQGTAVNQPKSDANSSGC